MPNVRHEQRLLQSHELIRFKHYSFCLDLDNAVSLVNHQMTALRTG